MSVSPLFLLEQAPTLKALSRAALGGLKAPPAAPLPAPSCPGPWVEAEVPPRSPRLVAAYVKHVGGDPSAYRKTLPAHLFPQWSFPLSARVFEGLAYPMVKVLNAGCAFEQRAPLPAGEPLRVRARLLSADVDERRALLTQEIFTGTASSPDALRSELRAYVPLGKGPGGKPRAQAWVPREARERWFGRVSADAGLDFAKLTGDINPIHWLAPYARAAGFRQPILHGFSIFARAIEALARTALLGSPSALRRAEARFVRPLPLPSRFGVYTLGDRLLVGDAPGGAVYLEGTFSTEQGES